MSFDEAGEQLVPTQDEARELAEFQALSERTEKEKERAEKEKERAEKEAALGAEQRALAEKEAALKELAELKAKLGLG